MKSYFEIMSINWHGIRLLRNDMYDYDVYDYAADDKWYNVHINRLEKKYQRFMNGRKCYMGKTWLQPYKRGLYNPRLSC